MKARHLLLVLVFFALTSPSRTRTRSASSLRWTKDPSGGTGAPARPLDAGLRPIPGSDAAPTVPIERPESSVDRRPGDRSSGRDGAFRWSFRGVRPLGLAVVLAALVVTGGLVGGVLSSVLSSPDGSVLLDGSMDPADWEVGVEPEPWSSDIDWAALVLNDEQPAEEEPAEAADLLGDVAAVQERLTELRYYVGPIDGQPGPQLQAALMAFQKVNGLGVDGLLGPVTLAALETPRQPALRGGEADRIEVDLDIQVLYLVKGGQLERVMPVSSGSGKTYQSADGETARSLTPIGTYRIERRIRGVREAPLGTLHDPLYFYQGWAIHGSNSVPAHPASHGCVRVTRWDGTWLFDRAPDGTQVILYGGTHVFTAGSTAAGTTTPAGDLPEDGVGGSMTPPKTEPSENTGPSPEPSPEPTNPDPGPTPQPTVSPAPSADPAPPASPDA